jgi:hypothetical protein
MENIRRFVKKKIMSQIPEDLIQALMQLTGQSRTVVEQMVQESIGRQAAKTKRAAQGKASRKPAYTYEVYPRYRPAACVRRYTLRIALRDHKPAIWRKVDVPSNLSLRHLGDLILSLMGWGGGHLNQFLKGNVCYLPYYQRDPSDEADFDWACENVNQEDYTIGDLLSSKGSSVVFEYDFGDGWEHDVRLSDVAEYEDGEAREIVFRGGKRACPPEDCGGMWGFEDLLSILAKLKAGKRLSSGEREHLEWADWDKDYDPEELNLDRCRIVVERFNGR